MFAPGKAQGLCNDPSGDAVTAMDPIVLNFFGIEVGVIAADRDEVAFHFGPHMVKNSGCPDQLRVEFSPSTGSAPGEFLVRRGDGTPLLRRAFRGWGNVPGALPPFAALQDRFCLVPAVVLAKEGATVALIGGPYAEQANIGTALAHRSWEFVSGRLLVLDRGTGDVLPYLVPLQVRGRAAAWLRGAGLPNELCRAVTSPAGAEVLLVRPECLGPVAPVRARLGRPTLIQLCRSADERVRLTPCEYTVQAWPDGSAGLFDEMPTYRLELPGVSGAEEAAGLIDQKVPHGESESCLYVPDTLPAHRAGLTASLRI
ncbi:hypothetical protein [Streptomyces sp. NPDC001165]|uniref:hypothetical protein n=1 Tax=Streptomyces sp. NPDC001165 TaxID=3364546 RepID=UPI0036D1619F